MNTNLTFGEAIEAAKAGKNIARAGWGKMFVWLELGITPPIQIIPGSYSGIPSRIFRTGDYNTVLKTPFFVMMSDMDTVKPGWSPSQVDILAEDWTIVPLEAVADDKNFQPAY